MRRIAIVSVPCLGLVVALSVGLAVAEPTTGKNEPKKPPTVEQLMKAAHKGIDKGPNKGPSPLSVVEAELKKQAPDWKLVAENTAPLKRLADAIKDKEFGYRAPGSSYAKPVGSLMAATKKHDLDAARTAFAGLSKSCAGCHRR